MRETTEARKSSARGPIRKAKIRLDKGLAPLALGLARAIKSYKAPLDSKREGGDPGQVTHHLAREDARSDPRGGGLAIDVIERHLEKEARTRNLLDEQAIMRPKDLCKAGPRHGRRLARHDVTPRYPNARGEAGSAGEGLRRGMHSESVPGLHGRSSGLSIPLRIGQ